MNLFQHINPFCVDDKAFIATLVGRLLVLCCLLFYHGGEGLEADGEEGEAEGDGGDDDEGDARGTHYVAKTHQWRNHGGKDVFHNIKDGGGCAGICCQPASRDCWRSKRAFRFPTASARPSTRTIIVLCPLSKSLQDQWQPHS